VRDRRAKRLSQQFLVRDAWRRGFAVSKMFGIGNVPHCGIWGHGVLEKTRQLYDEFDHRIIAYGPQGKNALLFKVRQLTFTWDHSPYT
jgi:hypothetical protein